MLTGFTSGQTHEVIAVDFALMLPVEASKTCTDLNNGSDASGYPRFSEGVFVPHITLYQGYVRLEDRYKLLTELKAVNEALARKPLMLHLDAVTCDTTSHFFFFNLQKNAGDYGGLLLLQAWVHSIFIKYLPAPGFVPNGRCYADGNTDSTDLKYVLEFAGKHSLDKYWPHITLGINKNNIAGPVSAPAFPVSHAELIRLSKGGTCNIHEVIR